MNEEKQWIKIRHKQVTEDGEVKEDYHTIDIYEKNWTGEGRSLVNTVAVNRVQILELKEALNKLAL